MPVRIPDGHCTIAAAGLIYQVQETPFTTKHLRNNLYHPGKGLICSDICKRTRESKPFGSIVVLAVIKVLGDDDPKPASTIC